MELAFIYQARTPRGKGISGVVYARNRSLAFGKLKKNGFAPQGLAFSLGATVKNLINPDFNPPDLARFYTTMGRRIENNRSFLEGLDSAVEFVSDEKLRQAIMVMRQSSQEGQDPREAMLAAELPARDAMVIAAAQSSGSTGQAFQSLAREIRQSYELRRSVSAIFKMPAFMAFLMYGFFYGALIFVAPNTIKFLAQTNLKLHLDTFNQSYFDFATWFNANIFIASCVYVAIPFFVVAFLKSPTFSRMKDRWPRLRAISEKSDQAVLWNSYALLYNANMMAREACAMCARSAKRVDSREAFLRLGRLMESGRTLDESIALAGFPKFVSTGVKSAVSGGNVVDGLGDMVKNLDEDVVALTDSLKENVKIMATMITAAGVGLLFSVTYYPLVSTVLSAL
ncbi:hypothetical protein F6X40_16980 [Paraburkholderia sp. UCT31]|uniref:type II secretion system F family protein n=1 Tax=Paraburkholderia sp. UCT31 TaxID=2615209 RepID=UPI0016561915|nr:type II secretion system F family protein [Paraburkholderia sp. UCT31]MBC8738471.1 hypothetical protein [Paraburkholderia sp. UCT31]